MACFPHTPVGTPRRAIRCRCFFQQPKIKGRRGPVPARGPLVPAPAVGQDDGVAMDARADGPGDGDGGGDGPCDTAGRVDAVRLAGWRLGRALPCLRVWPGDIVAALPDQRSEEHTSELQSLMRISYAVFCLKKKTKTYTKRNASITEHKH